MDSLASSSVRDIPLPPDLTDLQRAEFSSFQEGIAILETEWRGLSTGENPDLQTCVAHLDEITAKRKAQAEERYRLRLEVIDRQVEAETERIKQDSEQAKAILFQRLARAYSNSFHTLLGQLKDLGGNWEAYAERGIDLPQVADGQARLRMQQPEEIKIRVTEEVSERDLRSVQAMFDNSEDYS
jgi:hypothetical protein